MAWIRCTGNTGGSLKVRTASGRIATFETNIADVLRSVKCEINAKQDLHGYDHPWAAGGGVNILTPIAIDTTVNGVRVVSDDSGKVAVTGTASADTQIEFYSFAVTSPGNYTLILKEDLAGSSNTYWLSMAGVGVITSGHRATFSFTGTGTFKIRLTVKSGSTTNFTVYPMVVKGNVDIPYEPYSNVCPIEGFTEANITRCGVNIWDEETANGYYASGVFNPAANTLCSKDMFRVNPGSSYYLVAPETSTTIVCYDENGVFLNNIYNSGNRAFTVPNNCYFINWYRTFGSGGTYEHNISINSDSTDTTYHPYTGNTHIISFGQEVYGGQLIILPDRTYFHATRGIVDLGSLNWIYRDSGSAYAPYFYADISGVKYEGSYYSIVYHSECSIYTCTKRNVDTLVNNTYCFDGTATAVTQIQVKDNRFTNANDLKTAVTGQTLVYDLATPFDIDLTENQIEALLGINNVWHDANGDTEVKFLEVVRS